MQLNKLRYGVLFLPLGFALIALVTMVNSMASSNSTESRNLLNRGEIETILVAPAEVTVNGQTVEVPVNGTKTVKTGSMQATVHSSSTGSNDETKQTTAEDSDKGQINVSVTTSSSNHGGTNSTNVSSFSSSHSGFSSSSSVHVNSNGASQVTVSK